MYPDTALINQRVNIRLDWLRAYEYPRSYFNNEDIDIPSFSHLKPKTRLKEAMSLLPLTRLLCAIRPDVAVVGHPIFIGLTVVPMVLALHAKAVNVSNSSDEQLVTAIHF